MQDRNHSDPDPEVSGVGGDDTQCLGGRLKQQIVDEGWVLIRDTGNGGGQGEDDMIVRERQ